tara:strand:- start:194 stop:472 length:279 start_codon:yes stop_codon:yes gene_type:complete
MVKASELVKEQKEREKIKKKIYKKIYKKVEKKIVQSSGVNLYKCWFQIPEFMINFPLYNVNDCNQYIMNKLKQNGFETELLAKNIIFISWSN